MSHEPVTGFPGSVQHPQATSFGVPGLDSAPAVPAWGAPQRPTTLVGDSERDLVCEQLSLHFSAGRLTHEEFDQRTLAALQARSRAELGTCLVGLPVPQLPVVASSSGATPERRPTATQGAVAMLVALVSGAAAIFLVLAMMAGVMSASDSDFVAGLILGSLGAGTAAAGFSHLAHLRRR
ncbi:DUF1707 domain-containing protein [Luteococcus peritonei]|uniref:DUF1707 domain-containing protein n=1 Tax=Luteococcus peritonei TaxID=88874 RepID=A0ABW4RYS1_9ACTN